MLHHTAPPYYWLFDPAYFEQPSKDLFEPDYWRDRHCVEGEESGRGTTLFLRHNESQLVLRHYYRGGMIGKLNRDLYWYMGANATRSFHEFEILNQLQTLHLSAPKPVAAQVVRTGLFYRADLIIERIPEARDLVSVLQTAQDAAFFEQLGQFIAQFHSAGVYHADLNIKNILHDAQGRFWLIDFDRARLNIRHDSPLQMRSIKRLLRSFEKEKGRARVQFKPSDWSTFNEAYQTRLTPMLR